MSCNRIQSVRKNDILFMQIHIIINFFYAAAKHYNNNLHCMFMNILKSLDNFDNNNLNTFEEFD